MLIPNLDVILVYPKRFGWKRKASVWCTDKRAEMLKNEVRFVTSDPKLPRIDPRSVHSIDYFKKLRTRLFVRKGYGYKARKIFKRGYLENYATGQRALEPQMNTEYSGTVVNDREFLLIFVDFF